MVAALLFLPERALRNVASPFSSVMVCMSAPVSLMSPLLSYTDRKSTRAGHLSKVIPITWCFIHYISHSAPFFLGLGWFSKHALPRHVAWSYRTMPEHVSILLPDVITLVWR